MRPYLLLIACAAIAAPAAVSAETGATQGSPAESSRDGQDADRPICRRVVATGSVMGRRVCRTRTEWDAISARGQSDMRRTQDQDRSRSMTGVNNQ